MKKKLFIINTITKWEEPPRARHQVAYALSKYHPVIFISASRLGVVPRIGSVERLDNLDVLAPYFPVHYKIRYRIPFLNKLFQIWLFRKLRKRYRDPVIINFDFTAKMITRYFQHVVYYCNDDHITISYRLNPGWIARSQEKWERDLIHNATCCIGTSEYLVDKMKKDNRNSFEIRLGAPDIDQLPEYTEVKTFDSRELIKVGIVGYVETMDPVLLDFLLAKNDLFVILVGPDTNRLEQRYSGVSNIRITGSLTGQALYSEVRGFDVGLIPYDLNSTRDRTPNKLWLYLALGIPVVISNISGIKNWTFPDRFVYRSDSQEEFYRLIKKARAEDTARLEKERILFARQNSWDVRIRDFIRILERFLPAAFMVDQEIFQVGRTI